jgi:hypothetical protein
VPGIAIRLRNFSALGPGYQKLFPHFSEARTTIFSVKQVEDGGHESNLLFDFDHLAILWTCTGELDHTLCAMFSRGVPAK